MDEIKPVALALGRYGFPNGDEPRPVPEPMKGYWTPWHIAQQAIDTLRAEVEALRGALEQIGAIGNDLGGGDWDEIEEARGIAFRALERERPE